jgi:hypothetical protein
MIIWSACTQCLPQIKNRLHYLYWSSEQRYSHSLYPSPNQKVFFMSALSIRYLSLISLLHIPSSSVFQCLQPKSGYSFFSWSCHKNLELPCLSSLNSFFSPRSIWIRLYWLWCLNNRALSVPLIPSYNYKGPLLVEWCVLQWLKSWLVKLWHRAMRMSHYCTGCCFSCKGDMCRQGGSDGWTIELLSSFSLYELSVMVELSRILVCEQSGVRRQHSCFVKLAVQ